MRIGIDAGRALHGDGGVAAYTRELIRGLAGQAPEHELVLFDLDRGARRREAYRRALGPLPAAVEVAPVEEGALRRLDLFHAPGFRMPPVGAPRTAFTLHDLTVLSHPECHTEANRARTMVSIAEALSRGATVIAVSEATRLEAERLLALDPARLEVVPPIVSASFGSSGDDEKILEDLGVERPFVLVVAGFEPRKNLGRLLDAWELLPAALRDRHRLVMVSSAGWLQSRLRRRVARLRRAGGVVELSGLQTVELAALYRRTRALVFPSLAEGFGLPVAEAMACGAPVITSDRSSMSEVAGGAAVLVDPEDTADITDRMVRVLSSEELRRDLRERGLERAERFDATAVVPGLLAVYARAARMTP